MNTVVAVMLIVSGTVMLMAGCFSLDTRSKTVWTEDDGAMVSVVARSPDGKTFNILRFDRSFLENGGTVTGIEMVKPPPTPSGVSILTEHRG